MERTSATLLYGKPHPLLPLKVQHQPVDVILGILILEVLGKSGIANLGSADPGIGIDPQPDEDRVFLKTQIAVHKGGLDASGKLYVIIVIYLECQIFHISYSFGRLNSRHRYT